MFFSDKVTLKKATAVISTSGDIVPTYVDTIVFADHKSITRTEFYTAVTAGIKVSDVFTINSQDYGQQTELTFSSTTYEIVRAYQKGLGVVDLMCNVREVG